MCDQAKQGLQTISLMEMTNEGWRKIEQRSRIVLEDFGEGGWQTAGTLLLSWELNLQPLTFF